MVRLGVISKYISDDEVVSNLRQHFDRDDQYRVNFYYWLSSTARVVREGVLVDVGSRRFLLNADTGVVVREVFCGGDCKC